MNFIIGTPKCINYSLCEKSLEIPYLQECTLQFFYSIYKIANFLYFFLGFN